MPEPLLSDFCFGNRLFSTWQQMRLPSSVMRMSINDSEPALTPCLKAFYTSEMNIIGAISKPFVPPSGMLTVRRVLSLRRNAIRLM